MKYIILCINLLLIGCSSVSILQPPKQITQTAIPNITQSDNNVDVTLNTSLVVKQEDDPNNFLIIKNHKTGKEWKITYSEWEVLTKSYQYWGFVTNQKPKISEVTEDDNYLYIVFNYYDLQSKDVLGFKFTKKDSILSGRVIISKKYLIANDYKQSILYQSIAIGTFAYGILATILIIIIIL